MDIVTILLAALSRAGAIVLKLGLTELQDWLPTIARRLVDRAVARLPESERGRYYEEWHAHLSDCPGKLSKICHAIGCYSASIRPLGKRRQSQSGIVRQAVADCPRKAALYALRIYVPFLSEPCWQAIIAPENVTEFLESLPRESYIPLVEVRDVTTVNELELQSYDRWVRGMNC